MPEQLTPRIRVDETRTPRNDPLYSPSVYLRAVRAVFERANGNPVGQIVMGALARDVLVFPVADGNTRNAFAGAAGGWTGVRGSTPQGEPVRWCSDDPSTPGDETGTRVPGVGPGTGAGVDVRLQFSPWMWGGPFPGNPEPRAGDPYAPWADEVFLHELVHAVQQTRGVCSCAAAGHNYDTFTEYCAVTVESMYMSCHPGRPARTNHHGFVVRPPDDSSGVLPPELIDHDESVMLARFRRLMPNLTDALEQAGNPPMTFNPFTAQRRADERALSRLPRRPASR